MIHKLINRSRLRDSAWLAEVRTLEWRNVQRPPREGLGIQAGDLIRNLDGDAVAHRIQDKFLEIAERAETPSERVESDGYLAEFIHKALDGVTPREASGADFWAYLVTFGCPQYPRCRGWRFRRCWNCIARMQRSPRTKRPVSILTRTAPNRRTCLTSCANQSRGRKSSSLASAETTRTRN